ncbi:MULTISPECIES: SDR family oxidoreductase [Nocardiaceae]|uniref:SDR family oxidoreductase n=1 Tax=Nocardiaceae TaxID=85025 RepID=UPI0005230A77|nr:MULTISPECIES: SDR family oxidoreductase [Rhodococcus]
MTRQVVLVTGGSGGIGRAIGQRLNDDYQVALGYSRTKPEATIGDALWVQCDVTSDQSISEAVETVRERLGPIYGLVNNAGVTDASLLAAGDNEGAHKAIDTNLLGSYRVTQQCIADMLTQRTGRILFMSSVMAAWGSPGQIGYAASKSGMIGMARSLAWELGRRGITSNAVLPGLIRTEMLSDVSESRIDSVVAQTPLKRVGRPDEVAGLIRYLLSEEAGFITGASIPIGGGIGMGL